MEQFPKPLLWYLIIVTLVASMITWIAFLINPIPSINEYQPTTAFIIFIGLALSVSLFPIHYNGRIVMFLSTAIDIAATWILDPIEIIFIIICSVIINPQARTNWRKALFNTCYQIIVIGIIAIISSFLTDKTDFLTTYQLILAITSGVFYITSTTILVGTAITLSDPSGYTREIWQQNVLNVFTYVDVTLFLYGFVLSILWFVSPQAFILGLALLATMYWSLRSNADLRKAAARQQQFQHALANLLTIRDTSQQLKLLLKQLWHMFSIDQSGIVLFPRDDQDEGLVIINPEVEAIHNLCSQTDVLQALGADPRIRQIDQEPTCQEFCKLPTYYIPLIVANEVVGAMLISVSNNRFVPQDFRLLTTYGTQAALTVVQARLIDHLRSSQEQLVRAERLAAIGKLSANLAHEFNNVLAIICTTAEAAIARRRRSVQAKALQRISESAKRGGSITRGLLTFTRHFEPRRDRILLQDAIEPILAMLATRFRDNHITVVQEIDPALPLIGDTGLLAQAVLNLVTNALDAMPNGGTITVKTWRDEQTLHLQIKDDGPGLPDSVRKRLFEPFTTSKPLIAQTIGGTGLGLAITFGIVASHEGTLAIESEPGAGTTISITLPAAEGEPAPPPPVPPKRLEGPQRVMIVDDEPLIASGIADILTMDGHEVMWFEDSEAAVAALDHFAPEVLIADIQMPGVDGKQLLKIAQERFPEIRQVLITGQTQRPNGASPEPDIDVIPKPFTATDLYALLGRYEAVKLEDHGTGNHDESDEHPAFREELRHELLNHVSSLESTFRMLQSARSSDPSTIQRVVPHLRPTICKASIFLRSQHMLGLLDRKGEPRTVNAHRFPLIKLLEEAHAWTSDGLSMPKTVSIRIECSPDLEIVGDTKSLLAALLAAIRNAIESITRAAVADGTITISARQNDDWIILGVEDNGEGFDEEILEDLTQYIDDGYGEQFIGTLEPRYGLGMGIPVTVHVAKVHGGMVAYGNHADRRGAWLRWTFPAAQPRDAAASEDSEMVAAS